MEGAPPSSEETGALTVEKSGGKSAVVRCFSKYPLKLIVANKAGTSKVDAVWVYALSYGGGIVSGDQISINVTVGDECTLAMTTQASTKVYKSIGLKCSEQILEARVGNNSLLAIVPDPVTCFATARYSQKQIFRVCLDSNLVIVDWITSGRHESGERWDFLLYKSTNNIFLEENRLLFLDSVLLDQRSITTVAERMQEYNVMAMVIIMGPKLKHLQSKLLEDVKIMMSGSFRIPTPGGRSYSEAQLKTPHSKPALIASCSMFGPKGVGLVIRVAAVTTDSVYAFLRHHLSSLEPLLGAAPYS